jgi:hypothetical protein
MIDTARLVLPRYVEVETSRRCNRVSEWAGSA